LHDWKVMMPSHLSIPFGLSPLHQRPHLSSARRLWSILDPSPHRSPVNESTSLQKCPKHSFFVELTGPRPVATFPGRSSKSYWTAPHPVQSLEEEDADTDTQTTQSSSNATRPPFATQSHPALQGPQRPQTQPARQYVEDEYDYGCWGSFCHAFWCFPRRRRRRIISAAVQATAS